MVVNEGKGKSSGKKSSKNKIKIKTVKKMPEDFKSVYNILKDQDIDKMLDFLKKSRHGNSSNVMDLDPYFIDRHSFGVEMFMKMAIKLEPKNPTHHYNYALFLETQAFYNRAKKEFEKAINLDKENETYRLDYGNLLLSMKDYEGAEEQYLAALEKRPDDAHMWTNLGILYSNRNESKKAVSALKKAISLDPNFPLSYLNLVQLYKRLGENSKAQVVWNKYKNLEVQDLGINVMNLASMKRDNKVNKKER